MEVGLACHVCGQLNLLRAQTCTRCGTVLAPTPVEPVGAPAPAYRPPAAAPAAAPSPAAAAAPQPRFDPATGQPLHPQDPQPVAKTMFFGALQQQAVTPRLVVIKGEGGDGVTYHLTGTTQTIGRQQADIQFADDVFLSPQHARFTVQDGRLFVQDLGSTNGVFLRIKRPSPLDHDDRFLVGEQLLRLDSQPLAEYGPDQNGTYFYGSARPEATFRVVQQLAGGGEGLIASARGNTLSIGREANVLNFPDDRFISGHHAQLDHSWDTGQVILTDTGSRNGTFIQIKAAQELFHGDYLFVGQQLFRIEIS
jgi:pSer/pThr/pTyr-binding forkhead associated (FHA) protein